MHDQDGFVPVGIDTGKNISHTGFPVGSEGMTKSGKWPGEVGPDSPQGQDNRRTNTPGKPAPENGEQSDWSRRYADQYRYRPILDDPLLPNSCRGRVRIYFRGRPNGSGACRFILNWFEAGRNCKRTVRGDKFTAVTEADRINERLATSGCSGLVAQRVSLPGLIDVYSRHLDQRADAEEISARSAARYQSALRHVRQFTEQTGQSQLPAGKMGKDFALNLKAYLCRLQICPNGHPHAQSKPISETGVHFIMGTLRAAWNWAQQQHPPFVPIEVRNPLQDRVGARPAKSLVAPPDVDTPDIVKLIETADLYQLILFLPIIVYGLRAAEPCYLMVEDWNPQAGWLTVAGNPELDYKTKGRINKTLPVPTLLARLLTAAVADRHSGPLFPSRARFRGQQPAAPTLATTEQIIQAYQRQVHGLPSARQRLKTLQAVLHDAGMVTYDQLACEFRRAVHQAALPGHVTLKALRHHFAAALEKANISYFTRKHLMGHRVRRDPLVIYTTMGLETIRSEFDRLLQGPLAPIISTTHRRMQEVGCP